MSVPGRVSTASHELDFLAESLPGLAWTYYTLQKLLVVEVEREVGREDGPVYLAWVGSRRLVYLPATGDLLLEDRLEASQTRSADMLELTSPKPLYQARESSLVPLCLHPVQFMHKT